MNPRRAFGLSLAACLVGAALAAYAITRTWSVHVTPRTGMSDLRTVKSGTDLEPWVTGLALVALAGAGALLATHGWVRRGLGGLLTLAGLGILAGAIIGRAGLDVGAAGGGGTLWPIACALGGAIIAVGGLIAARHGHRWPRMSARYERKPAAPVRAQQRPSVRNDAVQHDAVQHDAVQHEAAGDAGGPASLEPADHRAAWDALDRGDDPTA
jgi:uncharacterized membrane protein (TIGR02234 family)